MKRRVKKKARRKLKTWVKLTILGFFLTIIIGAFGYRYYTERMNAEDPTGTITETETETFEEEESITHESLSYKVMNDEGTIFIDYGDVEVIVEPTSASVEEAKLSIDDGIDYVISSEQIDLPGDIKVHNVIGFDVPGVNKVASGETVIIDDGISLSTIDSNGILSTYLVYKDCSFLSIGDIDEEGERYLSEVVATPDVVVTGSSRSLYVADKEPRFVVIPESDIFNIVLNMFSGTSYVYATGKTGDIEFKSQGSIVTPMFDTDDYLTPARLAEIEEGLKEVAGEPVETS